MSEGAPAKKRRLPGAVTGKAPPPPSRIPSRPGAGGVGGVGGESFKSKLAGKLEATKHQQQNLSTEVKLSTSQHRVLQTIMQRQSVFFTGAAGSGKSYVLKVLREVLELLGLSHKVAFTAPTGIYIYIYIA
jgi:hypothetical protein